MKGGNCLISPNSKMSLSSKRPGVSRMKRHGIKLLHQETDEHFQGCLWFIDSMVVEPDYNFWNQRLESWRNHHISLLDQNQWTGTTAASLNKLVTFPLNTKGIRFVSLPFPFLLCSFFSSESTAHRESEHSESKYHKGESLCLFCVP